MDTAISARPADPLVSRQNCMQIEDSAINASFLFLAVALSFAVAAIRGLAITQATLLQLPQARIDDSFDDHYENSCWYSQQSSVGFRNAQNCY